MRLSIVIPAYNEAARIGPMLDAYLAYFEAKYSPSEVELIVSVNGSTDDTEAVVRSRMAAHPALRIYVDPAPIGKGGAIIAAGRLARGDLVGFVDADGATPPAAFDDLVANIGDAGLIIASRALPGAVLSPRPGLRRRIASRIFNTLVRTLFRLNITDTQCGAKLMTAEAWHAIVPTIGITRWAFDVDMLFKTRLAHYSIREIPTTWSDVSGSKIELARASFQMFLAIVRLRLIYSPFRFVVHVYDHLLGRVIPLNPYGG
jgi:glycosyltransferase involved in cell wall biosynthesis